MISEWVDAMEEAIRRHPNDPRKAAFGAFAACHVPELLESVFVAGAEDMRKRIIHEYGTWMPYEIIAKIREMPPK